MSVHCSHRGGIAGVLVVLGIMVAATGCTRSSQAEAPAPHRPSAGSATTDASIPAPEAVTAPGRLEVTRVEAVPGRPDEVLVSLRYLNAETAWVYFGESAGRVSLRWQGAAAGGTTLTAASRTLMDTVGLGSRLMEPFACITGAELVPRAAGAVQFVLDLTALGPHAPAAVSVDSPMVDLTDRRSILPATPPAAGTAGNGSYVYDVAVDGVPGPVLEEGLPWVYQGGTLYSPTVVAGECARLQECLREDGYPDARVTLGPEDVSGVFRVLSFHIVPGRRLEIGTITGGPPWMQVLAGMPYSHRNRVRLGSIQSSLIHKPQDTIDLVLATSK